MKMKSIATLTFATTVAFAALLVGAVATRAASLEALTGTYGSTAQQTYLSTDSNGFNSGLQPIDRASSTLGSVGFLGLYVFDGRGNVTVDLTYVSYSGAAFTGSGEMTVVPNANNGTFSVVGSYTVGGDGKVTVTLANVAVTFTGGSFVIDELVLSGWLALDKETLMLSIPEPAIEKQTYSTKVVRYRICQRSDVLVKVDS